MMTKIKSEEWTAIKKALRTFYKEMEENMMHGFLQGKTGWENWEPAIKSAKEKLQHYENLPDNASEDEKVITLADCANYLFMEYIRVLNVKDTKKEII